MSESSKEFRWQSRATGLTYPQCGVDKEVLRDWLMTKLGGFGVAYLVVAHEKHQDGGDHLHAGFVLEKKPNVRQSNFFDYEGFHPNIQALRDKAKWMAYCKKDGDFVEWGEMPSAKRTRDEICTKAGSQPTFEEALKVIETEAPSLCFTSWGNVKGYLTFKYALGARLPYVSPYPRESWKRVPEIEKWFAENVGVRKDRYDLLVVVGDTKLGKTSYIRSFGDHVYWKGNTCMESLVNGIRDGGPQFLVMDDHWSESCDLDRFPSAKTVLLGTAGVLTDKYMGKRSIDRGLPYVFLANEMPHMSAYWRKNSVVVVVSDSLF